MLEFAGKFTRFIMLSPFSKEKMILTQFISVSKNTLLETQLFFSYHEAFQTVVFEPVLEYPSRDHVVFQMCSHQQDNGQPRKHFLRSG